MATYERSRESSMFVDQEFETSPDFEIQGNIDDYEVDEQEAGENGDGEEEANQDTADQDEPAIEEPESSDQIEGAGGDHDSGDEDEAGQNAADEDEPAADEDESSDENGGKEDDDDGGNEDEAGQDEVGEDNEESSVACSPCQRTQRLVQALQRRLVKKDRTIAEVKHKNQQLRAKIRELKEEIRFLKQSDSTPGSNSTKRDQPRRANFAPSSLERTWPSLLEQFKKGQAPPGTTYRDIWRKSNKEENMSVVIQNVHPNIMLVAPGEGQVGVGSIAPQASNEPTVKFENFDKFPLDVQLRIWRFVLVFKGCLIHIFSRLDPFEEKQPPTRSLSGLPAKIFISDVSSGKARVSISEAMDPAELLRPLLTCKRWAFFMSHVFLSMNTFAFSSFGEFERFANGIGHARLQRIQHIEINWKGGVFQKNENRLNTHSFPLIWLREALRLRTLVVWVAEKSVIRRAREPKQHIKHMAQKTSGQPNARLTRSMRSLFGLDYLLTLRGMKFCRFYCSDTMRQVEDRPKSKIRDQSFARDVDRTVCMEKVPAQAKKAEIWKLDPLVSKEGGWFPRMRDYQAVEFEMYDNAKGGIHPNDLDKDCTEKEGTPPPSSSEDSGDSESDGDSDNDDDRQMNSDVDSRNGNSDHQNAEDERQNDDEADREPESEASHHGGLPSPPASPSPSRAASIYEIFSEDGEEDYDEENFFKEDFREDCSDDGEHCSLDSLRVTQLMRTRNFVSDIRRTHPFAEARDRLCSPGLFVTPGSVEYTSTSPAAVESRVRVIDLTGIDEEEDNSDDVEEIAAPKLEDGNELRQIPLKRRRGSADDIETLEECRKRHQTALRQSPYSI